MPRWALLHNLELDLADESVLGATAEQKNTVNGHYIVKINIKTSIAAPIASKPEGLDSTERPQTFALVLLPFSFWESLETMSMNRTREYLSSFLVHK